MDVDVLLKYLPASIVACIKRDGITELNEPQIKALEAGLFSEKNMVIAAPTASGKTLIAELAALHTIINQKRKTIYVVPLRAIGSEKYKEFREKYADAGISIALSMGDYDSKDPWLKDYDLIIVTSEKLDSLMRHGVEWIRDAGLVVLDEIHLLNDISRGATLEIVTTKLRLSYPYLRFIALSATISNAEEIAGWLDAELVVSDFRPVPVRKGVFFNEAIRFVDDGTVVMSGCRDALDVLRWFVNRRKQVLCFASSRRNAESTAEKLSRQMLIKQEERKILEKISSEILNVLDTPTEQCRKLASCVKNGTAFHHAGLVQKQRELIEEHFREGLIKVIVATPTLAAGVNLPASVVLIKDILRYEAGYGMRHIPVLEFEQMAGRSGRPRYDKEGLAIAVARSEKEAEFIMENYLLGVPEPVYSKLGVEPVLRIHLLGIIASVPRIRMRELLAFMERTFYAYQYGEMSTIERQVRNIAQLLEEYQLVEQATKSENDSEFVRADRVNNDIVLKATKLGKRVSELYIDPETAHLFIEAIKRADNLPCETLSILHLICLAREAQPLPRVRKALQEKLTYLLEEKRESLLVDVPDIWSHDYNLHVGAIAGALLLMDWMDEKGEEEILKTYGIAPGDLRVLLENSDWLLYSMAEIARILKAKKELIDFVEKTRLRVIHGVREELLELVQLRGIGRARARKLWNEGVRSIKDIKNMAIEKLERVLGKNVARSVVEQLKLMENAGHNL